jgi:hypothetical protein
MKKVLLGLLLLVGVNSCFAEGQVLEDDGSEFSFAEFSLTNLKEQKRQILIGGGVALAALGYFSKGDLEAHLPKLVTNNINANDLSETVGIMGGVAAFSAFFNHGPRGYGKTLPEIGELAIMKQVICPGVSGRHELKSIVGLVVARRLVRSFRTAFENLFE